MIRRATLHRCVAWLALAAMALIMLMPVVSRSIPVANALAGMGVGCAMNAGQHSHPSAPGYPDDPTAKCGYCTLLNHTPVVGGGLAIVHLAMVRPASPVNATTSRSAPFARLLSASPRGPPSRVNV